MRALCCRFAVRHKGAGGVFCKETPQNKRQSGTPARKRFRLESGRASVPTGVQSCASAGRRLDGSGRPTELRFGAIHLSPLTFSLVPLSADPAGTFDERGRYRSRAGGAGEDAERWRFVCLSAVRTLAKEPLVSKGKAWCAQPWHMEHLDTHPSVHLLLKCLI